MECRNLAFLFLVFLLISCGRNDEGYKNVTLTPTPDPSYPSIQDDTFSCTSTVMKGNEGAGSFGVKVAVSGGTAPYKVWGFGYDYNGDGVPRVSIRDSSFSSETRISVVLPVTKVGEADGYVEVMDSAEEKEKVRCDFNTLNLKEDSDTFQCQVVSYPYPSIEGEVVKVTAYPLNSGNMGSISILSVHSSVDSEMIPLGILNGYIARVVFPFAGKMKYPLIVRARDPKTGTTTTCESYQLVAPRIRY